LNSQIANEPNPVKKNIMQKMKKKQLAKVFAYNILKLLKDRYWAIFEAIVKSNQQDFNTLITVIDRQAFWDDVINFLSLKNGFVSEENLLHLKDDQDTLFNLTKLYGI